VPGRRPLDFRPLRRFSERLHPPTGRLITSLSKRLPGNRASHAQRLGPAPAQAARRTDPECFAIPAGGLAARWASLQNRLFSPSAEPLCEICLNEPLQRQLALGVVADSRVGKTLLIPGCASSPEAHPGNSSGGISRARRCDLRDGWVSDQTFCSPVAGYSSVAGVTRGSQRGDSWR